MRLPLCSSAIETQNTGKPCAKFWCRPADRHTSDSRCRYRPALPLRRGHHARETGCGYARESTSPTAVRHRDQIGVPFVLDRDVLAKIFHQQRAGLVRAAARGARRCGTRSPSTSAAATGSSSTRPRDPGHLRRDRGADLGAARARPAPATRSRSSTRPTTPTRRASRSPGRAPGRSCCAAATGASSPTPLAAAITPRTRVILLNTPHNPTGRVLDASELELLAAACREHDLIALTDEVYEHLVFDGTHIPIATLPGWRSGRSPSRASARPSR